MDIIEEEKENTLVIIIIHYINIIISAEKDDMEENINTPILFPPIYDQTL
jgi:hypothetical protein